MAFIGLSEVVIILAPVIVVGLLAWRWLRRRSA